MRRAEFTTRWKIAAGAVAVALAALLAYLYFDRARTPPETTAAVSTEPAPAEAPPEPHYPVPDTASNAAEPLPEIDDSDPALLDELVRTFGDAAGEVLVPDSLVRRIVATVDSLSRQKLAARMRPVLPPRGALVVEQHDDTTVLGAQNYARYEPLVQLVQAADTSQIVALYYRFYPRFQEAYEQLGYPDAYFNDRLVAAIDDILATPDVQGPIELTRPRVLYEYADPDLESRSVGQKVLIRMGPENSAIIRQKLRDIRREITSHVPQA